MQNFALKNLKEVRYWSTFNEILSSGNESIFIRDFPPGITYDFTKIIACLHNMMYAHRKSGELVQGRGYAGEGGVVHSLNQKYPASDALEDQHAAFLDDALSIRFLLDATYLGYYSDGTLSPIAEICEANDASCGFPEEDLAEMKRASLVMIT